MSGRKITHAWGGPIDASPTHLPLVLPLRGGRAFAAAGYTGNGVGPSHMVGRTLASLALDRHDEPSRLAFVDPSPPRVPPEPFHWLGGEAIRRGIIAKEEAQLAGEQPGWLSSKVVSGARADRLPHRPLGLQPGGVAGAEEAGRVARHVGVPARAGAGGEAVAGVEAQAGDDHVDVVAVGVDRDPAADPALAPVSANSPETIV